MIIAKNRPFLRKIDPAKTIGAKEANCSAVPKHLLWPEDFPLCQRPVRGTWQSWLHDEEHAPPLTPDWPLLKRMEATINSYLGLMGHADARTLRKNLYEKHFGPLQRCLVPATAQYTAVHAKKYFLHIR